MSSKIVNLLKKHKLKNVIRDAQEGDAAAFKIIFDSLNDRLFVYAFSHTSDRDAALDAVQETFIELWKALNTFQYRSDEAFYGFVFIVLKRRLYRYYTAQKTTQVLDDTLVADNHELIIQDDHSYILKGINKLTSHYQELLKLRYWSDMTFREIASVLNIKETTAKVRHYRALQKLKVYLDPK